MSEVVMAEIPENQDKLTEEEAAKRRDEALKRALGTPPKPHKSKQKKGADRSRPPASK